MRRRLALLPLRARLALASAVAGLILAAGLVLAEPQQPATVPGGLPPGDSEAPAPAETPSGSPQLLATIPGSLEVGGAAQAVSIVQLPAGPLFSLAEVASRLGGVLRPGPGGAGWILALGEVEAVVAAGSPVATVGRQIVNLSQPVSGAEGGPWVPLDMLQKSFGDVLHWDLVWSAADRRLIAEAQRQRVVPVDWNLVHLQGMSTLVLQFPEAPRLTVHEGGQRLEVELLGDQVAAPSRPPEFTDPLVSSLRFTSRRIVLEVAPGAVIEHYQQKDPFRLVFDVYQRVATAPTGPVPSAAQQVTIVVDPGHGGVETGAIGPTGTQEKELTLLLAQGLARELQRRLPVRVELTRDEDADLPLDTRAAIANQNKAQLFISIHLNSSVGQGAHGAETYFLSLDASDSRAAAAARSENAPPGAAGVPAAQDPALADLQLILWDLAQTRHLTESQRFASLVQEELNTALGLRDRGVKQAPFRVLMGAAMPAVLVELGFISNPDEEKKLLTTEYREQLIDALVRAVTRYQAVGRPEEQAAIR